MATHLPFALRSTVAATAACCCAVAADAQPAAAASASLPAVTVTTRAAPTATVSGWGDDMPLARLPLQASVYGAEVLQQNGAQRLADLTRLDPAVSDAYNAIGYWDFLSVRGFVLDQRFNYRRDGLPINAETAIALDNKDAVEILKGTSGLQAGTSAPGGLVNYVVKRPTAQALHTATLQWRSAGSLLTAVDLSERFGRDGAFGLRVNAAYERLRPQLRDANGERSLLALAGDWRLAAGSLLEAEVEHSRQRQPSQPGFSVLGSRVPAPVDPRINLNNQPWSLPVVFDNTTASLRYTQAVGDEWRWQAHWMAQRLRSDDRLAFPFGCSAEGNFDRYCSNGSFDYYAFQSDGERRNSDVVQLSADGRIATGALTHRLGFGVLASRYEARLQPRLDDGTIVGTGSVDGLTLIPTLPALGTVPNTNRSERSTEFYLRDHIALSPRWGLWAGLRHTRLHRTSVLTDGSGATDYAQSFNAPWLAVSRRLGDRGLLYASWGRGSESDVAPNRAGFSNAGQALPALASRQVEVGVKATGDIFSWGLAAFDIERPVFADVCASSASGLACRRQLVGSARHRGLEGNAAVRSGAWWLQGGAQWLHARREGSQDASIEGQRPTNVPELTVKLQARYAVSALPGLALGANLQYEGNRVVLPDNSLRIPSFTAVAINGTFEQRSRVGSITWRAGIDNLFDRRAWRESPFQFGHSYLYPLAARSARLSAQLAW